MKVYAEVPRHLSQAMYRVGRALHAYAPKDVQFVDSTDDAELVVLHVIGHPETAGLTQKFKDEKKQYVIIQYCMRTTQKPNTSDWLDIWRGSRLTWSYYDLSRLVEEDGNHFPVDIRFFQSPLGLDDAFRKPFIETDRTIGIMTSGYVTAYCAEAIEEAAYAADSLGMTMTHLGPIPEGFSRALPGNWSAVNSITDEALAKLYRSSKWVSGLRHGEGFELPALEGLACGARPILFDRPEMRQWYGKYGVFVPECHGEELEQHLMNVLRTEPMPVTAHERQEVCEFFDWSKIVSQFWKRVL